MTTGYKQTEAGVIPEDWDVLSLGELTTTVASGRSKVRSAYGNYAVHGSTGVIGFSETGEYEGNAILVARVGANAGKISVVSGKYGVTDNTIIVRLRSNIYLPFFWRQLENKRLNSLVFGSGQPLITGSQLKTLAVSFPPLPEQQAIAEALSDVDALIESLEQLIAKKRHIKQGAMQELLTGKKRLPWFGGEWEVRRLGELVQLRMDRIDPRRTKVQEFCIELEHLEQGTGRLVGSTVTSDSSSLKSVFQSDDVLFGKLRAYLRKYWLATQSGVCSTEIWVLVAKRAVLIPNFLFQVVAQDRFIDTASSAYGTHMPRSDWNVIRNYEVHLPTVEEQTAIAAILSDMDAEIAALEAKLAKARQIKQGMMRELLTGRIRLVESGT